MKGLAMATYRVNEIFYSIQAEGRNAGKPAVFVRLAGCNLKCPFCDTDHEPYREMTADGIRAEVERLDPPTAGKVKAMVVFTGGEPTLQLNDEERMFPDRFCAMETNGTNPPPEWMDWITVSPKTKLTDQEIRTRADELKFLKGWFPDEYLEEVGDKAFLWDIPCYIQPTADKDGKFDVMPAIEFAKAHPHWTLSLQWHKVFNIQ